MKISNTKGLVYELTKKERSWVKSFGDKAAEALLCIRYALVYTRREPSWLVEQCRSDVEYTTNVVANFHGGFDEVRRVFEERMIDPHWYPPSGNLPFVEMARLPDGRPCGVVVQRRGRYDTGLGRPDFWMTFRSDGAGRCAGLHSGCLPSSLTLDRSGIFPGVAAVRIKHEKARKPESLPAGVPLQFLFVHDRNADDWIASAKAAQDALVYFNMASFELLPLDINTADESHAAWLLKKGVLALPHLQITTRSEVVLHLDGPFNLEQVMHELYPRFCAPGATDVEPGVVSRLLGRQKPGMDCCVEVLWHYYCDPERMDEIIEAFLGGANNAARRAAYVLDRLSGIKREVIQPHADLLLGVSPESGDSFLLRHVAHMLPRLKLTGDKLFQAESLLLQLSWQQKDAPLQVIALKSLRHFARTNFRLREYAGPFVYDLMRRTRDGRVVREAERTLDTIEYFEEKVHEQWDRLQANA